MRGEGKETKKGSGLKNGRSNSRRTQKSTTFRLGVWISEIEELQTCPPADAQYPRALFQLEILQS